MTIRIPSPYRDRLTEKGNNCEICDRFAKSIPAIQKTKILYIFKLLISLRLVRGYRKNHIEAYPLLSCGRFGR